METNYHPEWQINRVQFLIEQFGTEFFRGKRILELAPYNGYIGARFSELGAMVHCVEGRQDNANNIRRNFPQLSVEVADLDTPDWVWGKWDIIINFGLFYHLEKYHKEHLLNCLNNCKFMFFESVIFDSFEPEIFFREERGDDQSLTERGGSPSTSYVENIFTEASATFTKFSSSKLNGERHHYDWVDTNSKTPSAWARRLWVVSM